MSVGVFPQIPVADATSRVRFGYLFSVRSISISTIGLSAAAAVAGSRLLQEAAFVLPVMVRMVVVVVAMVPVMLAVAAGKLVR